MVVAVIALSAAAATIAGLAMAQTSLVSDTVDKLVRQMIAAVHTQNALNVHIKFGLLNLNQQTSLLWEQAYFLWLVQQMSCSHSCHSICVTSVNIANASYEVKQLNGYLNSPWNVTISTPDC